MMPDAKKIPLTGTGAERQARYAAKRRSVRDAERQTFYQQQDALLLAKYRSALTTELALNPRSRAATLFARRVQELAARLSCT